MDYTEGAATLMTIAGFFLLSEGVLGAGFGVSLIANVLWTVWALDRKVFGILAVNVALMLSSINGLWGVFNG